MSTGDRFAEQRRRNQTAYAIEDYHDAREGLRYTALGNLILSACVAVSLLSGADGPTHVLFALGSGGGVLLAPRLLTLERPVYLYLLLGTYTAGIVAEYVLAGLPSPPFPLPPHPPATERPLLGVRGGVALAQHPQSGLKV